MLLHTIVDSDPTMSPTARIAGLVKMPASLKLAIANWRELQGKYQEAHEELRRLVAENKASNDTAGRISREKQIGRLGEVQHDHSLFHLPMFDRRHSEGEQDYGARLG